MKQFFKFFVVTLTIVAWMPAQAQQSVVNDVKKMIKKESPDVNKYRQAQQQIVPALSHNGTKDNAETWFVAGKVMFGLAQSLEIQEMMFGDESGATEKGHAFINGYAYMQHALQLDSINGKPKYSKDIWVNINRYIDEYNLSAMQLFTAKDYDGAYQLFDIFCDLSPATKSAADIAEARFYQMFAAREMGRPGSSLTDVLMKLVETKQYDIANAFIDQASYYLKDDAGIYDMKGFVAEHQSGVDAAIPFYRKAAEIDATDGNRLFNLGRALLMKTSLILDNNPDMGFADSKAQLQPILEEALGYFNKAAALDTENTQVLRLIDEVKYRLKVLNGE